MHPKDLQCDPRTRTCSPLTCPVGLQTRENGMMGKMYYDLRHLLFCLYFVGSADPVCMCVCLSVRVSVCVCLQWPLHTYLCTGKPSCTLFCWLQLFIFHLYLLIYLFNLFIYSCFRHGPWVSCPWSQNVSRKIGYGEGLPSVDFHCCGCLIWGQQDGLFAHSCTGSCGYYWACCASSFQCKIPWLSLCWGAAPLCNCPLLCFLWYSPVYSGPPCRCTVRYQPGHTIRDHAWSLPDHLSTLVSRFPL